jgi:hypothetical protein
MDKKLIISLFEHAGYEYCRESPKNRLLFFLSLSKPKRTIQFWLDGKTDLKRAVELIIVRSYDVGVKNGKLQVRNEIKSAIGL